MTKEEAIQAMKGSAKVTHRYFTDDEWVTMNNGMIVLEDGVKCTQDEFWQFRQGKAFDTDWSIYNEY